MSHPSATMRFRLAAPEDAPMLHALIEAAYRGRDNAGAWDSESHLLTGPRTSVEEIAGLVAPDVSNFVMAEGAEGLLGCALIQFAGHAGEPEPPGTVMAYFGMFAIAAEARLSGLGKRLLAESEMRARSLWNAQWMKLSVISLREELVAWYRRRGYALTGERLPFPFTETSGETRRDFDLVVMTKRLTTPD